jgi:hypothetical protein
MHDTAVSMSTSTDRLLDEVQAAHILGCSKALMRKMRMLCNGPAYHKVGRLVRYAPADLQSYMAACRVEVK